jgi:hypothetical protein
MTSIAWLPAKTNELLDAAVAGLTRGLGERLGCAALVGNAMNPARQDRARAPEVIAITEGDGALDLPALAGELRKPMTRGVRVRLLTMRELDRSRDVFTLELAEWKARHQVLAGREVLADLVLAPADLRRGIEVELRGLSRRIKNRVLTGIATDRDDPKDAVLAGFDRLLVASFHALALCGAEPPREEAAILTAIGDRAKAEASRVLPHLAVLRKGEGKLDALAALADLLAFADRVTELVDGMSVP